MEGPRPGRGFAAFVVLSLLLGVLYRSAWPSDMEWKADERVMFEASQRLGRGEPLPWVGMPSGVGIVNPGMSTWVFAGLARLSGARDPVALGRAVMVLNGLALALLVLFALRGVEPAERAAWLWAGALAAVNPGAVQLHRKIWAQSVLPIFSLAAAAGWFGRRRLAGAFLWGVAGACLVQIHMSGAFFVAAVALWTALAERRDPAAPRTRWGAWALGTALAGWPLLPWARAVLAAGAGGARNFSWREPARLEFWVQWALDVSGLETRYSLGRRGFAAWLATPLVGGRPTWATGLLVAASIGLAAAVLAGAARAVWARRGEWRALLLGASDTARLQNAAFLGFGALLTLSAVKMRPHYLLVAFPLTYLWLARAALLRPRGRRLLAALWVVQALLAASFLRHVHVEGGSPGGDYGVAWSRQER